MAAGGAGAIRTGLFLVCCSCCCVEVGRRVRILGDLTGCDDDAGETGGCGVDRTRAFADMALVDGILPVLLLLWALGMVVVEVDTAAVLLAFRSRSAMAS